MSLKLHPHPHPHAHQSFPSSSSSSLLSLWRPTRTLFLNTKEIDVDYFIFSRGYLKKRRRRRLFVIDSGNHYIMFNKSRRMGPLLPFASTDDGVTFNGSPQTSTGNDVEEMRLKLNHSLGGEDYSTGLVQALHDAARVFELAIRQRSSSTKAYWFSTAWLGVDKTTWMKALSYQASVCSLLQAAIEISSRGDGPDRNINVLVQRSLLRQSAPLEGVIREKLSANQPEVYEWFWSEQLPAVVTSFVNYFDQNKSFAAATAVHAKGPSFGFGNASDTSLLMLALSCIATITKLGPTKVSCSQFFSMIPDITGRLMDMLVEYIPIDQAYYSIKDIGLCREFIVHFGPRASACGVKNNWGIDEAVFWVELIQNQLQGAIDRERIWSRLTTSESIEVLERDLAIFGFFIALGRSTQSFLRANGFNSVPEPIKGFIWYLIGGSILYYPQLSSISSYQLYVEVVCEELDWLPFYPGVDGNFKISHGHRSKQEGPPNAEVISQALDVCSHWIHIFIKYSKWLESRSNVKAARFVSRGHKKVRECMEDLGIKMNEKAAGTTNNFAARTGSETYSVIGNDTDSFDKALESVEEALVRLEELLQEMHVSNTSPGKEHLKAACSDLERIRKLKKEAEFLEASFRAKAASLRQGDDSSGSQSSIVKQREHSELKNRKNAVLNTDRSNSKPPRLWNFFVHLPSGNSDLGSLIDDRKDDEPSKQAVMNMNLADLESNEIQRFEYLRNELIELEKRVHRSADRYEYDEEEIETTDAVYYSDDAAGGQLLQVKKKESIIEKPLDKLKETSMDVLQGTQLLAIDVAAAVGLLRRVLIGDELTDKEKKALRRTLTDLASVVPIGFLMLLPVTAVGHAAMLAAIQRYVPALIPSTYGPERLDLLRQLEKMKEMETTEVNPTENAQE